MSQETIDLRRVVARLHRRWRRRELWRQRAKLATAWVALTALAWLTITLFGK